ncbi:MAG: chemotaxis protein CheX [Syntrophobacteraceae bacterium]
MISEVFETMFFTDVDFEECAGPFAFGSETRLVNGHGCVVLRMRISEKFARTITANFLGLDEAGTGEIAEEDLVDSLKEMANMVAGGCHAHAREPEWKLGIPEAWRIESEKEDAGREACVLGFTFSGEPAGTAALEYLSDEFRC